jgi:small conductance mechanosensitive channel
MEEGKYLQYAMDFLWNYGPNIVIALAMLVGGLWVIRRISNIFASFLKARKVDQSLQPFFSSLADVGMKVALLLMVAGRLNIETTSFIAIFSAIAFAIGFALQGSLGNFASGVLILLFRPYKIGDIITIAGSMGEVQEIQIFNTILATPQGKRIIIPNGKMTEGAIENIESGKDVRVDVRVSVKDKTDMATLKKAATAAVLQCPGRLEDRLPFIAIDGFEDDGYRRLLDQW